MKQICLLFLSLFFFGCSSSSDDDSSNQLEAMVLVNFSQANLSGSEENGDNLPILILTGVVENPTTVTVSISNSGTAAGNGVDFNFDSPQVITIPNGTYDGTNETAIQIPGLAIVNDDLQEGLETIGLALSNPTGDAVLGNLSASTYTINDDESVIVSFSQATGSDKENIGGNLPLLLIIGVVENSATVTITNTERGNATLGDDYQINLPLIVTIPEGNYIGDLNSAINIPDLVVLDDNLLETTESFELELSDPTGKVVLGQQTTTEYNIEGLSPCINNRAGDFPCNGYDLLGQLTLSELSADSANDIWGWTDSTTGKEYALVGLDNGVAFIDISEDDAIYLGKLPTATNSSPWRDVKVYEDYAFIVAEASGHGMQIFDLTKLRDVSSPPETFTADQRYTGIGNAHNVVINEEMGFAYPVGTARNDAFNGGVHFVNIQDPMNPTAAGGYGVNGYSHDAQVISYSGPDTDYVGSEIFIGANEDQIAIVDITDKANPTEIATISYSQLSYTHQGWFTEDQRYFLLGDELDERDFGFRSRTLVFDLQDLDSPVLHTTYTGPTPAIDHNGYVLGDEFFLANYTAGIRVLDISQIDSEIITETGFFDTFPSSDATSFDGVWSVYPYFESGKILINDINSGLFIVKKSN
jgi:choice-of-anchor B domain-containing protein